MIANHPKFSCRFATALFLTSVPAAFAVDATAPTVITTISGERFVGTAGPEEPGFVHLVSATLGEIRISRAAIRTMTRGPAEAAAPVAAPVAVPAEPPPVAPKPGFLQSRLHLPGKLDASLGLGLMAQSGILEQSTWSASANVDWKVGANDFQSSIDTHRQSVRGQVIDDAFRWDNRLQRDLSPKLFLLAARFYREDTVMAVEREEVYFLGPGYNVAKTPAWDVVTVVGPAYIRQQYLASPGLPRPSPLGDAAAVLYQSVTYQARPRLTVGGSMLVVQSIEDQAKQLERLMVSLDIALTETLSLSNSYFWMRDSRPRLGAQKAQGVLNTQLKLKL